MKIKFKISIAAVIIMFNIITAGKLTANDVHELHYTGSGYGVYFGTSVTSGDLNNDGFDEIIVGEYGYDNNKGKVLIYFGGIIQNMNPDIVLFKGNDQEYFGSTVAYCGDLNGDGYGDFTVSGVGYQSFTGRVYVYFGGDPVDTTADRIYTGASSFEFFGNAVACNGDANNDGFNDLIIGRNEYAYLIFGGTIMNTGFDLTFVSPIGNISFGNSLNYAGDLNGDGYDDMVIGEQGYAGGKGRVFVYLGKPVMTTTINYILEGESILNYFGASVASAGDINGDNYNDLVIGAQGYDSNRGRVYLFLGAGTFDTIPDAVYTGESQGDLFGYAVSGNGDFEQTGYKDFIVSAPGYQSDKGRVYLFFGGTVISTTPVRTFTGYNANDRFGAGIFMSGDAGNDGYDDILCGAPGYDFNRGAMFIYRYNHYSDLNLTAFIEGFYNASANQMTEDTIKAYIRNSNSPYEKTDSAVSVLNSNGQTTLRFYNHSSGNYYVELIHRNSIRTWSGNPLLLMLAGSTNFNMSSSASQAYGNNQKLVDNSPVRYAIYSGDVNQDDFIDGADGLMIDNDAAAFNTGYLSTDLNGDETIDGSDGLIADNNSANFVIAEIP